jgi:UDP-N-acetylglucosamine acyltransferase
MSKKIHPTAIIDPSAKIDTDVEIGPYSFIGRNVTVEKGSVIHACAHITSNTRMGKNNVVHTGAVIGELAQDITVNQKIGFLDDSWVEIGNKNTFFSYCLISRGAHGEAITKIGNNCLFLGRSHVGHDSVIGDHCVLSHNAMIGGHVKMGDFAHIGGGSAVHQHCRIGAYAMVGGMSMVLKDIFPFFLSDGRPAYHIKINIKGLQRHNFSEERIAIIDKMFKILRKDMKEDLSTIPQNEDVAFLRKWKMTPSERGINSFFKKRHE